MAIIATLVAHVLAAVLVVAGTIKVVDPAPASNAVRRLTRRRSIVDASRLPMVARCIGAVEVTVGILVLLGGSIGVLGASAALFLFVGFFVVTAVAVRRGIACGCWGSLSEGPAGVHELQRRGCLVALAAFVVIERIVWPQSGLSGAESAAGTIWVAASIATGIVLGTRSSASSWIPGLLRRSTAFGAEQRAVQTGRREVRGAERRRLLELVRNDPNVLATLSNIDHFIRPKWTQLRASRTAESSPSNTLVAVPGDGITLRIIVANDEAVSVIGETSDALFVASNGVVQRRAFASEPARLR